MSVNSLSSAMAVLLPCFLGLGAVLQLVRPNFIRLAYERWNLSPQFCRVVGLIQLMMAIFLYLPPTRVWGIIISTIFAFLAGITLLNRQMYLWSFVVILIIAALDLAALTTR
jgi:hypothetical protein